MSFSIITANPSWGTQTSGPLLFDDIEVRKEIVARGPFAYIANLSSLFSGAVNTSGINKPYNGWITYTGGGGDNGGGGGGSTRPTTGMIYPRGTC